MECISYLPKYYNFEKKMPSQPNKTPHIKDNSLFFKKNVKDTDWSVRLVRLWSYWSVRLVSHIGQIRLVSHQ